MRSLPMATEVLPAEEGEAEKGTEKEIAIAIERCRVTDVVEMNLKKNLTTIL